MRDEAVTELIAEARAAAMATRVVSEVFTRQVVTFGRVLREAGLEVGAGRLVDALRGPGRGGRHAPGRRLLDAAHDAGVPARGDRALRSGVPRVVPAPPVPVACRASRDPREPRPGAQRVRRDAWLGSDATPGGRGARDASATAPTRSSARKDFAAMSAEELAAVRRLIAQIEAARPHRRSRRLRAHSRGRTLDMRRLARSTLATGGDAVRAGSGGPPRRPGSWSCCATSRARWRPTPGRCCLPARRDALGPRSRGLRVRHPADPESPTSSPLATPRRRCARPRRVSSTGPRAPGSASR